MSIDETHKIDETHGAVILHKKICALIDEHLREHDDPAEVLSALEFIFGTVVAQLLVSPPASFAVVNEVAEMTFEMLKKGASQKTWPRPAMLDRYFASQSEGLEQAWEEMFGEGGEPCIVVELIDPDAEEELDESEKRAKKTPDMVN